LAVEAGAALVPAAHLAADAEVLAGTGEHQHVDLRIALGQDRGLLDPVVHLDGARVAPLGAIQDDAQHACVLAATEVSGAEIDRRHGARVHAVVLPAPTGRPPSVRLHAVTPVAP